MQRMLIMAAGSIILLSMIPVGRWWGTQAQSPGGFQPPNERERLAAIGSTRSPNRQLQKALRPGDAFDPIASPGPSDWLANHREAGQTFDQFIRGRPHRPDGRRNKIYLQPLGDFDPAASPDLGKLQKFAKGFFQLDVHVLPSVALDGLPIKSRTRASGLQQLLSTDVLAWCQGRLPADAFCLLAVTMEDLYPDESWNFVFGQASLNKRVGVYSFARYVPGFYGESVDEDEPSLVLLRSCKVLAHETGHMFGIKHCIHFHCLMNGSNHLGESDAQPLHLCPVCLRKLQWSGRFDIARRYEELQNFSKTVGWSSESGWLGRRLDALKD